MSIYDFKIKKADGTEVSMADYKKSEAKRS